MEVIFVCTKVRMTNESTGSRTGATRRCTLFRRSTVMLCSELCVIDNWALLVAVLAKPSDTLKFVFRITFFFLLYFHMSAEKNSSRNQQLMIAGAHGANLSGRARIRDDGGVSGSSETPVSRSSSPTRSCGRLSSP